MIVGAVNSEQEAIVRLTVVGPRGGKRIIEAVLDTGFNGHLTLPPELIELLRLRWRRRGLAFLADGSETLFDVYEGTVIWDGREKRIPIDEADTAPLIGMRLLSGHELNMQIRPRGKVTIKRLKPAR